MRLIDWIKVAGVAIAIIAGVLYIGELNGRVEGLQAQIDQLNPDKVREELDKGVIKLQNLAKTPMLNPKTFEYWGHGESEVEMIGTNEGFCYLTRVTGKFKGGGEAVWIHVKGGSWYLGGKSQQDGVGASARCWKWPA